MPVALVAFCDAPGVAGAARKPRGAERINNGRWIVTHHGDSAMKKLILSLGLAAALFGFAGTARADHWDHGLRHGYYGHRGSYGYRGYYPGYYYPRTYVVPYGYSAP